MRVRKLYFVTAACLAAAAPACAQTGLQDENFITPLPQGFKIGLSTSRPGLTFQEFVPAGETVQNWSEMVTIQILLGQKSRPSAPFLQNMSAIWARACPNMSHGPLVGGLVNGYPSATLLLTCSHDPITGKPETTLFRTVSGADSFYVAQYAFGHMAAPAKIEKANAYMQTVVACDTRTPAHPCANAFPKAR